MGKTIRLDKYMADMGIGTRSEVKAYIKKGRVSVDGEVVKQAEYKVEIESQTVALDGNQIGYAQYEYYMLNKPAGVVSAVTDNRDTTVVELIKDAKRKDLFPVGRLDKDTEGLLLITNDGELSHELLSPNKHVEKTYYAKIKGEVTEEDVKAFAEGLHLNKETIREEKAEKDIETKPAKLVVLNTGEISEIELTICEGKFHQVKRMFQAVGKEVIYLKRISMGSLVLDERLALGEYRSLTEEELRQLKQGEASC